MYIKTVLYLCCWSDTDRNTVTTVTSQGSHSIWRRRFTRLSSGTFSDFCLRSTHQLQLFASLDFPCTVVLLSFPSPVCHFAAFINQSRECVKSLSNECVNTNLCGTVIYAEGRGSERCGQWGPLLCTTWLVPTNKKPIRDVFVGAGSLGVLIYIRDNPDVVGNIYRRLPP